MTGWEIVGACILATPILVLLGFFAAEDLEACVITVVIVTAIVAFATVGAFLLTGAWKP